MEAKAKKRTNSQREEKERGRGNGKEDEEKKKTLALMQKPISEMADTIQQYTSNGIQKKNECQRSM